ncbi:hydroxymethylbilane synthase [Marinihelvus fidelis]|uniref:Porphobilinogen deaminase n=1 Tax=Marinihelvus fidelis TaxID=2613842 RepID=A0A5N0TAJ3_9GAMM|nr:hydroxymethylbilane synthase [Marinihelvus fidelis]KAA9130846.1 hydroxymethylbilane synthase [Marinihelvus fidelis]
MNHTDVIRIATRKSALAMWQANHVRDRLLATHPGLEVELVPMVTRGDRVLDRPLSEIGGKGLFLKELEQALLEGGADLAVHSMKDMPAEDTPGLVLDVALPRANPFDAWVCPSGATPQSLPAGARVGTSSLRRQCLLAALRPDLDIAPLRGNVDTRLARLDAGEYDAIILACAGLERLGLGERISMPLHPPEWLPAVTQGIIGLQCRAGDDRVLQAIAPLHDDEAGVQSRAERALAELLEGSCQVPLAGYCRVAGEGLSMDALVGTPDGRTVLRASGEGSVAEPEQLGRAVARDMLGQGAADIIAGMKAQA